MLKGKHSCTIDFVKMTLPRRCLLISSLGAIVVGLCLHFVSFPAAADEIPMLDVEEQLDQATPRGWESTTHHGVVGLVTVREEVGQALKLHADESSFSIQKEINVDLRLTPWLVWQWKVTALPEQGDFTRTEQDDQPAQASSPSRKVSGRYESLCPISGGIHSSSARWTIRQQGSSFHF
ncbi:MAG: hypothetical protein EWM73_03322 [Nitrospira sp.]|nr:MAG: hypothetical protein EWM73_03322 [Nitrospira sp.]